MDWKVFMVFGAVACRLGDKTQLATMLFATRQRGEQIPGLFAASAALIVATALGCWRSAAF